MALPKSDDASSSMVDDDDSNMTIVRPGNRAPLYGVTKPCAVHVKLKATRVLIIVATNITVYVHLLNCSTAKPLSFVFAAIFLIPFGTLSFDVELEVLLMSYY